MRKTVFLLVLAGVLLTACAKQENGGQPVTEPTGQTTEQIGVTQQPEQITEPTAVTKPTEPTLEPTEQTGVTQQPEQATEQPAVTAPTEPTLEPTEQTTEPTTESSESWEAWEWYYEGFEKEGEAYYDGVFRQAISNPSVGMPMTYDEISDMLIGREISFCLAETVRVLPLKEARALNGDLEVRFVRDLLTGEELDETCIVKLSMGTPADQEPADPCYAPGERFTCAIEERDGVVYVTGICYRWDVYSEDGTEYAYARGENELADLDIPGSENVIISKVTSTTQNPVKYTQRMPLETLAEFVRADWEQRGIIAP